MKLAAIKDKANETSATCRLQHQARIVAVSNSNKTRISMKNFSVIILKSIGKISDRSNWNI